MPDFSARVEQRGGRRSLHLREVGVLVPGGHVALLPRRRRKNREPNNSLARPLLLQPLHVPASIMLADIRAPVVVPFENYIFSAIVGEPKRFAIAGSGVKVRRWLTYFSGCEQRGNRA